jgi:hypothetical protein
MRDYFLECEAEMGLLANVEMKIVYRNIRQLFAGNNCNDTDNISPVLEYGIVYNPGSCHG